MQTGAYPPGHISGYGDGNDGGAPLKERRAAVVHRLGFFVAPLLRMTDCAPIYVILSAAKNPQGFTKDIAALLAESLDSSFPRSSE